MTPETLTANVIISIAVNRLLTGSFSWQERKYTTELTHYPPTKSTLSQIPGGVWVLGLVSMLMDISSEMIHCLLPLFMVMTLGARAFAAGIVEGLAESTVLELPRTAHPFLGLQNTSILIRTILNPRHLDKMALL